MTKYLMILAALFALVACGGDDGNDPVDNDPVDDNTQPDADTTPVWVTDKTYAGLEWSPLSENKINWQDAIDYCESIGSRLPTITELRKIIINCPSSTYGGACGVSDPDCLDSSSDCWEEEACRCDGTADSYSALGDGEITLWSSSSHSYFTSSAWYVYFKLGIVNHFQKYNDALVRCVR